MLVLSRKVGERIHIGNDIFVELRRVAGNRITLAVSAPKTVRILRGELLDAAREFDVLDDTPTAIQMEAIQEAATREAATREAAESEAAKDTVIMSGEEAAAVLRTDLCPKTLTNEQSQPVS